MISPATAPFVRFVEPGFGGFQLDVLRGWQVRGGLHHAGLGDRRWFLEARSPDNITILLGDPDLPQDFCHNPMVWGEMMVPYPQGCSFLNLPADPKRLGAYYLKNLLPQRLGQLEVTSQRNRPDLATAVVDQLRRQGFPQAASCKLMTHETRFAWADRVGGCHATCSLPKAQLGAWITGMTIWSGSVATWLSPPALAATAEQTITRMKETFRPLPPLFEVIQRDEAIITAHGLTERMKQQAWFAAQQAIHATQMSQGESITDSFWHRQQGEDHLSWGRSDAMLDRQRLSDDGMGQLYEASMGHNYYWLDQQSGQVLGTAGSNPPDDLRNYTALRKL